MAAARNCGITLVGGVFLESWQVFECAKWTFSSGPPRFEAHQCDQIRLFLNDIVYRFCTKVAQLFADFRGYFEILHFLFLVNFGKFGLFFILTSSHTGYLYKKTKIKKKSQNF